MNSVAIIGSGITGLTAAFELKRRGIASVLYEKSPRVGGVIRTVASGGYLAEHGPNTMLETTPAIAELIRELGLAERRLYSDPAASKRFIVRNKRPAALPDSPLSFFISRTFSAKAKLRLFLEPFIAKAAQEESVAQFVQRRLGREFLDYAIDPLVSGIYAGDPERLSIQQAFQKIHTLEQRYGSLIRGQILGAGERRRRGEVSKASAKKFSFDHGLQVLPDTLRERLGDSIQCGARVSGITKTDHAWQVAFEREGRRLLAEHEAVIFAGTAWSLAQLRLEVNRPITLTDFKEIYYPPVASVVLGFRRSDVSHPLDGFGMLVPRVEGFSILGTIFSSSLFPGRAPEGHVTLTTYLGGARRPELAEKSEDALVSLTCRDLETILGLKGKPSFRCVTVYDRAIPQYVLGYDRFKKRMEEIERRAPGFFLAGHFRDGVSLSDSILSGLRAGERIQDYLQNSPNAALKASMP
jgi:protoporphyrinogen/coproporphyrinogen III oxidase